MACDPAVRQEERGAAWVPLSSFASWHRRNGVPAQRLTHPILGLCQWHSHSLFEAWISWIRRESGVALYCGPEASAGR